MIKRNFPLILLIIAFLALVNMVLSIPCNPYVEVTAIAPEPTPVQSFKGRMVMPNLDDFYVLENSSGRDLVQLDKFLQGRAAGLHYLASEHFRNARKKKGELKDITLGLRLTLDSLGQFQVNEIVFSDTDDEEFLNRLQEHIRYYWRYPRSTGGKLDFWIPIRWRGKY